MKFTDILTDDSNAAYEPLRMLTFSAVVVGIVLEVYSVMTGKTFDLQAYGIGLGTLIGILGGVMRLNAPPVPTTTATSTTTVTETKP